MAKPRKNNYTDEDVKNAVMSSNSLSEVLRKLDLVPAGGNYECLKARIAKLGS